MTLKEIAKEAGVSISTVSRVLNQPNTKAASAQVQERIWNIVRKTGYVPNPVTRELRHALQPTPVMQSIYGLIACSPGEVRDDPFFPRIISSIEQEAFQSNFVLKYTYSMLEFQTPAAARQSGGCDSDNLIIVGRFQPSLLTSMKKRFRNIVYVGLNNLEAECDQVLCDCFFAVRDTVRYFYDRNHRNIAFIGAEQEGRYRGYLEGLRLCGLPPCPEHLVQINTLSMDGGLQGMKQLLSQNRNITAVICANDMTAIGALRACKELGVQVPDEISIIGINDIPNVRYVQPKISSIHVPLDEMGKMAVRTLADRINGGHQLPVKISLPYHIVERASCMPCARPSGNMQT